MLGIMHSWLSPCKYIACTLTTFNTLEEVVAQYADGSIQLGQCVVGLSTISILFRINLGGGAGLVRDDIEDVVAPSARVTFLW